MSTILPFDPSVLPSDPSWRNTMGATVLHLRSETKPLERRSACRLATLLLHFRITKHVQ